MIRTGIFLLLLFPVILQAQSFEVIEKTSLRTEPSGRGTVVKRVQIGDKGEVISIEKWWTQVILNEQVGYIKTANIKISKEGKTTIKTTPNIVFTESVIKRTPTIQKQKTDVTTAPDIDKSQLTEVDPSPEKKKQELSDISIALEDTEEERTDPLIVDSEEIIQSQPAAKSIVEAPIAKNIPATDKTIATRIEKTDPVIENKALELKEKPMESEEEKVVLPIVIVDRIDKVQQAPKPIIEQTKVETDETKIQLEETSEALEKKNQELKEMEVALKQAKEELRLKEMEIELEQTKEELRLKEQQLLAATQKKDSTQTIKEKPVAIETDIITTPEQLTTEADSMVTLVEKKAIKPVEEVSFISMIDVKAGLSIFKESSSEDVRKGLDFEVNGSLLNAYGLGVEVGLNIVYLPEIDDASPYINPFLGLTFGKYYRNLSFTIAPRFYFVTNPGFKLTEELDNKSTTTTVVPSFMIGVGGNLKYKLNKKLALILYGSFIKGSVELKETGTIDGAPYKNQIENKLDVIGTGIGVSYSF